MARAPPKLRALTLLALTLPVASTLRLRPPSSQSQPARRLPLLSRGAWLRGALAAATAHALPARADEEAFKASAIPDKIIGEIPASGLIFKDIVKISRFSDPKVEGVELVPHRRALTSAGRAAPTLLFSAARPVARAVRVRLPVADDRAPDAGRHLLRPAKFERHVRTGALSPPPRTDSAHRLRLRLFHLPPSSPVLQTGPIKLDPSIKAFTTASPRLAPPPPRPFS